LITNQKDVRNAETRKRTKEDSSETIDNLQRISHPNIDKTAERMLGFLYAGNTTESIF